MAIGDHVLYNGRRYLLIGIDPMSVTDRRAELEDLETRERIRVPLDALQDAPPRDDDSAGV
ncbi:MAG TPA: hypothetical protein VGQ84_05840 [Gaiellaceae bacterium]|jgi:hypothetical protein|nr:hypothetical protein [Gaiellaceae bacterium]